MTTHTPLILAGVTDEFDTEVQAMMMAMYSRNYGPIQSRLPQTEEEKASLRERLQKFYQGYGHKSVGQLGYGTLFLEGISQIAAKAFEDHRLFNGQESSTRYIDYSNQPMVDFDDPVIAKYQKLWRDLYIKAVPATIEMLKKDYPLEDGQDVKTWENTIKARTFDICRGLLPAGVVTNVGIVGTFDFFNDLFEKNMDHPSVEVSAIAEKAIIEMNKKYPDGIYSLEKVQQKLEVNFKANEVLGHTTNYYPDIDNDHVAHEDNLDFEKDYEDIVEGNIDSFSAICRINSNEVDAVKECLLKIYKVKKHLGADAKYCKLPFNANKLMVEIRGRLDFGSYRDLQRHRNGVNPMPMLNPWSAMNIWYIENLPNDIAKEALDIYDEMYAEINSEDSTDLRMVNLQYATPMGTDVEVVYVCSIAQLIYLLELRTGKTVHQTLRSFMHDVYYYLCDTLDLAEETANWAVVDLDENNFTLKRGEQTFNGEFK